MIKLFWDRDTGLIIVAPPHPQSSAGFLVVQFSDAQFEDDVIASLLLDPAPGADGQLLGAVPVGKLQLERIDRMVVRVCAFPGDGTTPREIVREAFSLQEASRDPPPDTDLWGIDRATKTLRIVMPPKSQKVAGDLPVSSVRPFIDSPEALYRQAAEEVEGWRSLVGCFGAKWTGSRLHPSAYHFDAKAAVRIAVSVVPTGRGVSLRLLPLDDTADLQRVDVFRLPLATLLGPATGLSDSAALGKSLSVLSLRRQGETLFQLEKQEPLDRIVLCAHSGTSLWESIIRLMRGGDAAVDKVPLDFGFINQDGAFRSVGPVYALASYVNTLEPDPPLSHALRAAVQPLAGSAYGKIGGRLCSSPVRATFDQYRDHSGILPDEAAFLQHADRAVFPRGEKDAQPGLDDERAVLDHLWARVHRLSSGNAATEDHGRDGPAWLERVLDASVPVDLVRSVLLDADCLDMVRRLKPLPDASNPSKFFLQLKALADSLREKAAEEEVAQWLNVPQRPKPMSRIGEWQDWSSRLNWALIAAEGLGAQPLAVMRQRFPRIEPIVRTAFGVGNARDADLAVVMLRTGLWMAKDRVRFSITGNLRPADAGRLIAEVARELAEGLDHARSEFSRPVIAEGPPDATGSWDDSIADVASDFWENIFVPLLGAGSGDMPDGLERTISDYMQAGSQ